MKGEITVKNYRRNRTETLSLRLTAEEKQVLKALAEKRNLSMTDYILLSALHYSAGEHYRHALKTLEQIRTELLALKKAIREMPSVMRWKNRCSFTTRPLPRFAAHKGGGLQGRILWPEGKQEKSSAVVTLLRVTPAGNADRGKAPLFRRFPDFAHWQNRPATQVGCHTVSVCGQSEKAPCLGALCSHTQSEERRKNEHTGT